MKFNPTTFQKWAIMCVLIAAGLAVLLGGFFARHVVLKANPCQMTYSKREKSELAFCGKNCEYKLWKISNPLNKKLNPQPVLYIPGHLGSANQARSFASHMHNEDEHFQYFALDFERGSSALHGSDLFAQAHVTNQALSVIQGLYAKKKSGAIGLEPNATRKIMLVGHSVGGMVARAAPLLSNHPACAVRDVVQLSAPNSRPPYAPDASLDAAYQLINHYWTTTYRNSSALPEVCAHLGAYSGANTTDSAVGDAVGGVVGKGSVGGVGFACPTCLAGMRLISVTGGDVDLEVPSHLTDLNTLFPAPAVPKRVVVHTPVATTDGMVYGMVKYVFNYSVKQVLGLVYGSNSSGNSTVVSGANSTDVRDGAVGVVTVDVTSTGAGAVVSEVEVDAAADTTTVDSVVDADGTVTTVVDVSVATAATLSGTTMTTAATDSTSTGTATSTSTNTATTTSTTTTATQAAPSLQFVSLRTSQLHSVGFPIDHAAVVWCYDLLHVLTKGMHTLSTTSGSVEWDDVFPAVGYNSSTSNSSVGSLAYHISARRQYAKLWDVSVSAEYRYITTALPYAYITTLPYVFVTTHLVKIVVCYLVVSLLVLAATLLRVLTGNDTGGMSSGYDNVLPWNHLSVDIVYAGVFSALRTTAPPPLLPHLFTVLYQLVLILLTIKSVYEYFMGTFLLSSYVSVVHWAVAYVLSLLVRVVLLFVVQLVQGSSGGVYSVLRSVLRFTVWNQTIRRGVRGVVKSVHTSMSKLPFYTTCTTTLFKSLPLLVLSAVWGAVFVTANRGDNRVTFGLSVLVVVVYIVLCVGIVLTLLLPTTLHKKATTAHTYYNTDLLLLYLPTPLLAYPTFYSAYRMLYVRSVYSEVALLYSVLDMGRVWYVLAVGAVAVHVWVARSPSTLPSRAKPLRFLYEGLGPHTLQLYTDVFGATYTASGASSGAGSGGVDTSLLNTGVNSGKNGCVHEDGGKLAIFEQIDQDEQGNEKRTVAHNVTLGSTYRVISCNCARDASLAEIGDWCSWCRCRKCGGKHLPAASKMRFNAHFSGANVAEMSDFSADLLPLVVLGVVAGASVVSVADAPFVYLYALGAVAVAFVVREWTVVAHK